MTPLEARIAGCIPLLEFGLDAILRLLTIEETDTIPTAAIPVGGTPRLLVNPAFVEAVCPTDEDLAVLVLHELHHLLLGHTRRYSRVTLLHNLAFDAVINAMLARARSQPPWLALFRRLYAADRFPEQLLRAPEGFPAEAVWPAEMSTGVRLLLTDLYYGNAGTFHDAFELLLRELPSVPGAAPLLLGSHDNDGDGLDPMLTAAMRAIVERWPLKDPRLGRSVAGDLAISEKKPAEKRPEPVLVRALLAAARAGDRHVGRPEPQPQDAMVAWPTKDRRAFAFAAAGAPPLLYAGSLAGRPRRSGRAPVAVYLDVSGSVYAELPRLLAAIDCCRRQIAPTVYQFSCGVEPVSLKDIARGLVRTRGGTLGQDFAAHLAASRARGAVVLTDGYVGPIDPTTAAACRRANLQVVLTPGGDIRDLAAAAAAVHRLEAP